MGQAVEAEAAAACPKLVLLLLLHAPGQSWSYCQHFSCPQQDLACLEHCNWDPARAQGSIWDPCPRPNVPCTFEQLTTHSYLKSLDLLQRLISIFFKRLSCWKRICKCVIKKKYSISAQMCFKYVLFFNFFSLLLWTLSFTYLKKKKVRPQFYLSPKNKLK